MSDETSSTCYTPTHDTFGEDIPDLMPLATAPPLPHICAVYPPIKRVESVYALRPRPPRPAVPDGHVRLHRKRVYAQQEYALEQPQPVPHKRGKTSGAATRSDRDDIGATAVSVVSGGSASNSCAVNGPNNNHGAAGTVDRVGGVRRNARQTRDVVVKEERMLASASLSPALHAISDVSGSVCGGMTPTLDVGVEVSGKRADDVSREVEKVEVKVEVKEESGDDEDDEDGECYDDDEDDCGSGDTGEDSDGDTARVKTEIKREVKREVKAEVRRDMEEGVEEDVSRGTVQLSATQSGTRVRTRPNPWVCATNPHGFMPATLARLQELSPEARERGVKKLLKMRERNAKRLSDPAVREMDRVRKKEYCEKNREKRKQRSKEYREKNPEKKKQRDKEYREKNTDKEKQRSKEWREKNKEKEKQRRKEYYENNKEKVKQQKKEYCEKNPEKVKEWYEKKKQRVKEYYEKNRDQLNARARERRARKKAEREAAQRAAADASAESV